MVDDRSEEEIRREEEFRRWIETGSHKPMRFWKAALILGAVTVPLYGLYAVVIIGLDALGWLEKAIVGLAVLLVIGYFTSLAIARRRGGR